MNADNPPSDPAPDEPTREPTPGDQHKGPKKKRRHLLGLPPGYKFDPNAKPTLDDLSGIPACFGDDPQRPGQSRTESDGLSAG